MTFALGLTLGLMVGTSIGCVFALVMRSWGNDEALYDLKALDLPDLRWER